MLGLDWLLEPRRRRGKTQAEVVFIVAIGCCAIVKRGEFWESAGEHFFSVEVCEGKERSFKR